MTFNENAFNEFPVIETERCILRMITDEDIQEVFDIYSSLVVMKYFGRLPMNEREEAQERIKVTAEAFEKKEGIRWAINYHGDRKMIGSAGIWRIDRKHFRGEIGYDLLPEHYNKGVMTEVLIPIISFGFNEMNLHTIEANTHPENAASRKLLEKLGFEQEGYLKESYFFNGQFEDTVIYSLIKK